MPLSTLCCGLCSVKTPKVFLLYADNHDEKYDTAHKKPKIQDDMVNLDRLMPSPDNNVKKHDIET
jgi:hypothetical protein